MIKTASTLGALVGIGLLTLEASANRNADGAPATPPNILVILLDDVGPDQLQCYDPSFAGLNVDPGSNLYTQPYPYAPTPNISSLARNGVRFTRAFTSPVCSPSRAMLMTGRYSFRNQIGHIITANGNSRDLAPTFAEPQNSRIPQLPSDQVTIAELVASLAPNYELGMFGKWHLSASKCAVGENIETSVLPPPFGLGDVDSEDHPYKVGWQIFRGLRGNIISRPTPQSEDCVPPQRASYFNWFYVHEPFAMQSPGYILCPTLTGLSTCLQPIITFPAATPYTLDDSVMELREEFVTPVVRQDVQDFVLQAEASGNPWLAVWAPQACHGPFTWPPEELHDYGSDPFESDLGANLWPRFRALLQAFDTELGKLRAALSAGPGVTIWDRTVVILLSDNGTDENVMKAATDPNLDGVPGIIDPYVSPGDYIDPVSMLPAVPQPFPSQPTRFKGSPYVSGSNMPCIISGPVVTSPGRVHDGLVDMVDIFSTIRELVGIDADWPIDTNGPNPGYAIDGISLCRVLQDVPDPNRRRESMALMFSPNGPFDLAGDTRLFRVGYAREEVTGEIYHLVRQQWVNENLGAWDLVINEPDHLYQLCDTAGVNVDTQEVNDLASTQSALLTSIADQMRALLLTPDVFQ